VARWPELRARLAEAFAARTRAEWTQIFEGTDACVAPVLSLTEAGRHPHLAARGTYADRDGVVQPAPAPRFSATPAGPVGRPAEPGEHTREVLADWGLPDADGWLASGAVHQRAVS
jgi:alpha-methylacyl-CoA racemase